MFALIALLVPFTSTAAAADRIQPAGLHDQQALQHFERALERGTLECDEALMRLTLGLHFRGKELPPGADRVRTLELSRTGYRLWFEHFDHALDADLQFSYGMLLEALNEDEAASRRYTMAVDAAPDGPHAELYARSALFTAIDVVEASGPQRRIGVEMLPITPEEHVLFDAARDYEPYANGQDLQKAILTEAQVWYGKGHFEQSTPLLERVIEIAPETASAELAARWLVDTPIALEDWEQTIAACEFVLDDPRTGVPAFRDGVQDRLERAWFKYIEQDPDPISRAVAFVDFADRYPDAESASLALHNAAVHFDRAGDPRAAAVRLDLLQRYPQATHAVRHAYARGFDLEDEGDVSGAIEAFEAVAAYLPNPPSDADLSVVAKAMERADALRGN